MNDSETGGRGTDRAHDLVLWGATGYTGRLAATYLVGNYLDADVRIAFGARSRTKLEELRDELASIDARAAQIPILVGDSLDVGFVNEMAASTRVVCTTVGPYGRYGAELVASCVGCGTHYCDLTAEIPFIRKTIDTHNEAAGESGARIVHGCGFDSIPSDLGVLTLQEAALERFGRPCREVKFYVTRLEGGLSGGTMASALKLAEDMEKDPSLKKLLADSYALNPAGSHRGTDTRGQHSVTFDEEIGQWTAPFLMESINTRVVRRTNALFGDRYGTDFRYAETMATGAGTAGWVRAAGIAALLGGFQVAVGVGPLRRALQATILPSPGQGPSQQKLKSGSFRGVHVGRLTADDGDKKIIRTRVEMDGDPGYAETAKMLVESGLCLIDEALAMPGGVHTPASAMGMQLVRRLRAKGIRFETE